MILNAGEHSAESSIFYLEWQKDKMETEITEMTKEISKAATKYEEMKKEIIKEVINDKEKISNTMKKDIIKPKNSVYIETMRRILKSIEYMNSLKILDKLLSDVVDNIIEVANKAQEIVTTEESIDEKILQSIKQSEKEAAHSIHNIELTPNIMEDIHTRRLVQYNRTNWIDATKKLLSNERSVQRFNIYEDLCRTLGDIQETKKVIDKMIKQRMRTMVEIDMKMVNVSSHHTKDETSDRSLLKKASVALSKIEFLNTEDSLVNAKENIAIFLTKLYLDDESLGVFADFLSFIASNFDDKSEIIIENNNNDLESEELKELGTHRKAMNETVKDPQALNNSLKDSHIESVVTTTSSSVERI